MLPKKNYRFKAIFIKLPGHFSTELEQKIFQNLYEKTIINEKGNVTGDTVEIQRSIRGYCE